MHAYIIAGGLFDERITWINNELSLQHISSFDTRSLDIQKEALSIGIKEVKEFIKQLLLAPIYSKRSAGIIKNAHFLTPDSQNALLKTLEEPPQHANIYIELQDASTLLPTILSRCQIIQRNTKSVLSQDLIILQLCDTKLSVGQKMALLDNEISNKEEAKIWVTQAIHTLHANRTTVSSAIYKHMMNHLLTASSHLAANVSYKLAIDQICVHNEPVYAKGSN